MIFLKNKVQQDGIRRSADLLSRVFSRIGEIMAPGICTQDIDRVVKQIILSGGGFPAFLGYDGFPASVCTSVNNGVIHGIPNTNPLKSGDIVGCDIGVILNDYYSDACKTFPIGAITEKTRILLEVTQASLKAAIDACRPGNRIKDIGKVITGIVKPQGFSIVRNYCGHGVGLSLHEEPQIPNYYPSRGSNPRLKPGMVLAIEPMINEGQHGVEILDDGWTVVTADGLLSAHFEHSILVTSTEPEILTSWEDE